MSARSQRYLWLAVLLLLIAICLFPLSNRITRAGGMALFAAVWFGLIALCWRRRPIRIVLIGITAIAGIFLALPAGASPSADALRADYIAALKRYEGVNYYWGGESPTGIDCSGLIRRGLIDAKIVRGVKSADAALVRRAMTLWWNDCTANALGASHAGLTTHLFDTPSINELDHSKVSAGDLAVTKNGIHIMAYLGNNTWIEADPAAGRVLTVSVPSKDNAWFTHSDEDCALEYFCPLKWRASATSFSAARVKEALASEPRDGLSHLPHDLVLPRHPGVLVRAAEHPV